jgi:propanol-preferring alcohol dehydrogenase
MAKMKVVQVREPGKFDLSEREIPTPNINQVRIKINACGVCHSDIYTRDGVWPNINYPRIPGHEVAGVIDELGSNVTRWKKGQRVGVGWAGGRCGQCNPCRKGDFVNCETHQVTGIHYDGGYAEYMIAPVEALAAIPDELSFEEAAPLLCAGITTFNSLRHSHARAGDLVAIQGIGGLGHLAIQFANKMGFKTVAISKGKDKEALALKLGAHVYINTEQGDVATNLQKLGGAKVILATAPSGKAITPLIEGLGLKGELMIVGASTDPIEVTAIQLIRMKRTIRGWPSGSAIDSEETMKFCALTGIRPMIEKFSLDKAPEAYDQMISNRARFRAVITSQ